MVLKRANLFVTRLAWQPKKDNFFWNVVRNGPIGRDGTKHTYNGTIECQSHVTWTAIGRNGYVSASNHPFAQSQGELGRVCFLALPQTSNSGMIACSCSAIGIFAFRGTTVDQHLAIQSLHQGSDSEATFSAGQIFAAPNAPDELITTVLVSWLHPNSSQTPSAIF